MNQSTHINWLQNNARWLAAIPSLFFFVFSTYFCLNTLINEFETMTKFKLMALTSAITLNMVMLLLIGSGFLYLKIRKAARV